MALNKIASEIRTLRISEENKSEDIKSKFNLTLYTSYLIEISKQTGQEFHETANEFLKLFLRKISLPYYAFDVLPKTYFLFITLMNDVIAGKYTIKTELEEKVIFSIISFSDYGNNKAYYFDIDKIFEDVDTYTRKNGKYAKEVKEALSEIIEKYK